MNAPILIVVEGPPPRKNERHVLIKRGKFMARKNSAKHEAFVLRLELALRSMEMRPSIAFGRWRIDVHTWWPRARTLDDGTVVPFGDWDAPLSGISDALEAVDAVDDDLRFLGGENLKHYDKDRPRVEITLTEIAATHEPMSAPKRRKAKAA